MIYTGTVTIRGKEYRRTHSDAYMVMRDGVEYAEAIDPIDTDRVYVESTTPLDDGEATAEDYEAALAELGVSV